MRLYHFTSLAHLRGIREHGLTVGDVVTSFERVEGRVGVWLTSSSSFLGHGLEGAAMDKTAFRLELDVPEDDRLVYWNSWAEENISADTRRRLNSTCAIRDPRAVALEEADRLASVLRERFAGTTMSDLTQSDLLRLVDCITEIAQRPARHHTAVCLSGSPTDQPS